MDEQHTLGHLDCPACAAARKRAMTHSRFIDSQLTFSEGAEIWLDAQRMGGEQNRARYIASQTLKDYVQYVASLSRFFDEIKLAEIHSGHMSEYQSLRSSGKLGPTREALLARHCKWHDCSPEELAEVDAWHQQFERAVARAKLPVLAAKVNQELGILCRILKRANVWTPELEECYQPLRPQFADVPRALTTEQQKRFLEAAASREEWQVVYWYSQLAIETTLTNCEMRGLRVGDVSLYQQVAQVRAAHAKNAHRVRTVPLTPNALWAAGRLLDRARALGATEPDHYLFPLAKSRKHCPDEPMSSSGIRIAWEELREAAGVPWFRIHDLRHTAITRMAEAGVPLMVIMSIAGHISTRMTQHYTQISEAAKRKALLEAFAAGKKKPGRAGAVKKKSARNM